MTGTGEKKCRPRTRSGRPVAAASPAIGIDEVFDARIASSPTTPSSAAKVRALTSSSSTIASTTSSASARAPRSLDHSMRATSAPASSSVSLPRWTARATEPSIDERECSSGGGIRLVDAYRHTGARCRLRNARSHEPGADDADALHVCHERHPSRPTAIVAGP